jgi:large subunit ribosomal protein L18
MSKARRQIRTRSKIRKNIDRLRLTVFRSNKYILAQIIDDSKGKTLISVSEKELKEKGTKTEEAKSLGLVLAKKAVAKKIIKVVFDKGSYAYHGRVKAFADAAREGGLEF